jgi:DnaJ-class molecular chaperone
MQDSDEIATKLRHALAVMELPVLVSYEDIKKQYRKLSRKYHPDLQNGEINPKEDKMRALNEAYALLKHYIFHYRFSFSDEEIKKQFPESGYGTKFRF